MASQVKNVFSRKWLNFPFDPTFQKQWFLERYGWTLEELKRFVKGKTILDAGCGVGWFAEWMADLGAKKVVAVDFCDFTKTLENDYNLIYLCADITNFSFDEKFDWINCDQVIHHTEKPHETFKHLTSHLKGRGLMTVYVYRKKGMIREGVDCLLRSVTTCNHYLCLVASTFLTGLGFLLSKINLRFQRAFYWNVMKCFWNDSFSFGHNVMVNYDWYAPKYAYRFTAYDFIGWFKNMKILKWNSSKSGYSIRAMRINLW